MAATRTGGFVSDSDVIAIIRRMDSDGDDEVSFSDFFSSLLPYFIFNDPQALLTLDKQVDKAIDQYRSASKTSKRSAGGTASAL